MAGDYARWLEISKHSKVGYIDESLGTYRVLNRTVSRPDSTEKNFDFAKSVYRTRVNFINKYGASYETKQVILKRYNKEKLKFAFILKDRKLAKQSLNYLIENFKDEKTTNAVYDFFNELFFGDFLKNLMGQMMDAFENMDELLKE